LRDRFISIFIRLPAKLDLVHVLHQKPYDQGNGLTMGLAKIPTGLIAMRAVYKPLEAIVDLRFATMKRFWKAWRVVAPGAECRDASHSCLSRGHLIKSH
jgi:hypothetical protein